MAKNPEERLLVCTLQPVGVGEVYERLPLHVTVQPWFTVERVRPFTNALINMAYETDAISIKGGDEARLGVRRDIKVRTLQRGGALGLLHDKTSELIRKYQGQINPSHTGEAYLPHVTYLHEEGLAEGEQAELTALQLFKRTGERNDKAVEQVFYFQGK